MIEGGGMMKKIGLLALIACLFLIIAAPVQAQERLVVLDSSAQADFPARLTFSLSASSGVNIVDIRLRYIVEQTGFAQITSETYIAFTPASQVDVSWSLETLRIGGLPPGINIDYWWVVTDASGNRVETTPEPVQFTDSRYPWRSLTEGEVTILWYDGSDSFAGELQAAAHDTLSRLLSDTGAHLEKPATIYIYASTADLQGALVYPSEWTGGVAYVQFSTIAIGISPLQLDWGKGAIAHELTHLVTHQMTFNPYGELPNWLTEGLAVYAEGLPSPAYTSRLFQAIVDNNLISVRSLSSPFSAYPDLATLSYAESYSLVSFLIQEYGQSKMLELLNTFKEGSSYDAALIKVYGFDMDGLDSLWQDYVRQQYLPATQTPPGQMSALEQTPINAAVVPVLAALAPAALFGIGVIMTRRRRR
jgi:hypothetical protein